MVPAYQVPALPDLRLRLLDLGLACCALEVGAAALRGLIEPATDTAEPPALHVLVVAGTVTDSLAPAVQRAWRELPRPGAVLSFGACASTGGPYWDSPVVLKGVDQVVPVAVYVPGCPPPPEALVAGLAQLRDLRAAESR